LYGNEEKKKREHQGLNEHLTAQKRRKKTQTRTPNQATKPFGREGKKGKKKAKTGREHVGRKKKARKQAESLHQSKGPK